MSVYEVHPSHADHVAAFLKAFAAWETAQVRVGVAFLVLGTVWLFLRSSVPWGVWQFGARVVVGAGLAVVHSGMVLYA